MIKIDLITGFLGSGKTTFLLKYAGYLKSRGLKLGILEYDHGAVNVDMLLLQELRDERCELEMISAACDSDCLKRRFRTKLISMAMSGYDRVIVEPSGIFDVDEFFDTLREAPLDRWYEPGSVIAIVDAGLDDELSPEADFLLVSQAACAGRILLSRTQLVSKSSVDRTRAHIKRAATACSCSRELDSIMIDRDWSEFSDTDYAMLMNCDYRLTDYVKLIQDGRNVFDSLYYLNSPLTLAELSSVTAALFSDDSYGKIIRIKGFIAENGSWYRINAVRDGIQIEESSYGKEALIVIGTGLDEQGLNRLMRCDRDYSIL